MKLKLLLLVLIFTYRVSDVDGLADVCPSGWSNYGTYCYKEFTSRVHWSYARNSCRGQGSGVDIVSIHSWEENTFIGSLITADAWIGMTEDDDEDYYWADGTHDNVHYWDSGNPNLDGRWHDADCVEMRKSTHRWNDEECSDNVYDGYVCKTGYCNIANCEALSFVLNPRSCKCTACASQHYLASSSSCPACTAISNCDLRSCTTASNQMCMQCTGDYGTALGQAYLNKGTRCEENCSWRVSSTICYPGACPDGKNSCACASGFTGTDCRTLTSSETPSMDYCLAKLHDTSGGTLELQCVDNGQTSYVRVTTLTNFENDWRSSYIQPTAAFPPYISSFALGMIRGITVATIYNKAGTNSKEVARVPCSDLANRNAPQQSLYHCVGVDTLDLSGWVLTTGDRINVVVEVENGGYVIVEDRDFNSQSKMYYTGRTLTRTGNYVFDFVDPVHCAVASSCSLELFNCGNDITKQGNIAVSWSTSGWTDPDSGINKYQYEIRKMSVQSDGKQEEVLTGDPVATGVSNGGTQLLLHPGLYSVVLEVFDFAGNVQLARRFILFDDINKVTFKMDTSLQVTSASPDTGFEWLTDLHTNIQVDWTNHYTNEFHDVNKLLNEIGDYYSTELLSAYDQWTGTRGRNAIPNQLGVVKFEDTYSLDHSGCTTCAQGAWNDVGISTSESYNIPRIDGDTITFWVQASDVMGNTLVDSVKVHVDSSEAIIQDLWLVKDGERDIAVHSSADLLEMNFEFQAFDAHSGLMVIHWELYDVNDGIKIELGSDHLSADHISDALTCLPPDCLCIPKGDCYGINYSFKPDMSRMNISDVKHDQEIYVKITVTNQAMLVANLTRKITVDTSPPHDGAVYDGSPGENEIDFQQELQVDAHWSGFFDKESGIKYYKYGFSNKCLSIDDFYNVNMTTFKTTSTFATWTAPSTGKYYCTVVSFNNAVDPSNPVCSDGVTIDNSSPIVYDVIVENLHVKPGLVRNDNATVWFINQDLKRSLVDSPSDACISLSSVLDEEALSLIPVMFSNGTINSISDIECLQNEPLSSYSYLREDRYLSLTWSGTDDESEIFDYMVGLSSTPSDTGPDLVPFKSTGAHPMFKTYHPHLGEGVEFFIIIKAINRANLFITSVIGPIIVDVTPPSFTGDIYVSLDGEYLLAEWNANCFIDDEDDEPLTYYVAVGHSPGTSELLSFEPINETVPCTTISDASELCTAIPLPRLDWELHVNHVYFVSIKATNVAGLSTIGVSEPYYHTNALPTLGVVFDIPVRQPRPTPPESYVDIDCQSEKDAVAVYWYGFQNAHDEVSYQVTVGTKPGDSDVTKGLIDVGDDEFLEITNLDLSNFEVYYTTVVALSLAGSVNVSSDGVVILPKDAVIYGAKVADGEPCSVNGSCVQEVDFQSSSSSYSSYWHIASNMTSLVTHVIWTMEKEIDSETQIWTTIDGPKDLGMATHIKVTGLDLEYGGHYRSKVEFCNSNICFDALYSDGSWVISTPPTPSNIFAELIYDSNKTSIDVAFEPFAHDTFQLSENLDIMDYYEWSLANGQENNGMLLPWQQVNDIFADDDMITFQSELKFDVSTFTCIHVLVRGYDKAGLSSATSTELWDCDEATEADPNIVIDASAHVELEENANWNEDDVDYSLQKSSLHALWPTLRYFTYEWSAIGVSPSEYTPDFNLVGIDTPCAHPNTITCGETDDEYINVDKLNLKHGSRYFICIHADETTKYYETWTEVLPALSLCSDGVVIDHTPPSRGEVWLGWQRGDRYQHSTTELSINWDSFVDVEEHGTAPHHSGIESYQYSVGTFPGGIDVIDFVDVGITNHVIVHSMNLRNGQSYYVTIKATDFVGLTSSSVSQGITVDNTPPTLSSISIRVDGGVLYSTSSVEASWDGVFIEHESSIFTYEWSIGSKPYWADIYPNTFTSSEGAITNENYPLDLQEGHHYYITVKAYNGAGLSTMACSGAITVDTSPPSAGFVYDGPLNSPLEDKDTQQDTTTIFANWGGFVDRGIQIISYSWKVGLCPGCDDVMEEQSVGLATDARVEYLNLIAGLTYYTTVTACDAADLCTEVISDGILIDNSPPVAGFVFDGSSGADINFQNSRRILEAHWWGFNDPHSGLSHFEWWAGTTPGGSDVMEMRTHHLSETVFTTLNTDLPLHTRIYITVKAYNKVGLSAERTSDGFVIDATAPEIIRSIKMSTSAGVAAPYTQVIDSLLHVTWEFADSESGIKRQYLSVFTHHDGDVDVPLTKVAGSEVDYTFTDLSLHDGSRYQIKVVACNAAELCTEMSTQQILVDSTPPTVGTFAVDTDHAADLDRHQTGWMTWHQNTPDSGVLNLAWLGFVDPHSDVSRYRITVGSHYSASDLSPDGPVDVIPDTSTIVIDGDKVYMASIPVKGDIQSTVVLYISLWAVNGVGLASLRAHSAFEVASSGVVNEGMLVLIRRCSAYSCEGHCICAPQNQVCLPPANSNCQDITEESSTPIITVYDVIDLSLLEVENQNVDVNFTFSRCMLAATWSNDGSSGIPVERYEWSAGDFSSTSKQPKGIFNAAVDQVWFDVGQETSAVLMLDNDKLLTPTFLYYFFVRAWYSDSSYAIYRSDGITVDIRPPDVTSRTGIAVKEHMNESSTFDIDFLTETDHVSVSWRYVFRDESGGLSHFEVSLSTFPGGEDIKSFQVLPWNVEQYTFRNLDLKNGQRYYSNVRAYNHAGLHTLVVSDGFIVDLQPPVAGTVLDGKELHDVEYQSSPAVVKASWHGFVDFESFTSHFESCIGETSDPEECNVKEWQRVEIDNSVTSYLSRNLTTGLRYFTKVRSYDAAGHVSPVAVSDGFVDDTTPPEPIERVYYGENIVQNPSFEDSPHTTPWSGQLEGNPDWIVSEELLPAEWSIMYNSSLVVYTAENSQAQDGTSFVLLHGGLTQSVKTALGHHYMLTFYTHFVTSSSVPVVNQEGAIQAPGINHIFKLYNKANGNQMYGSDDVWQRHTYFFTADATESKFVISTVSVHGMMMVDNVTISSYSYDDENENSATVTADGAIHFQTQFIHDWSSIHALWHFVDPESPIVDYTWAIGTVPGGTQVQGFKSVGTKREATNTDIILQNGVKVYVTVVSTNAAGLATRVISAPLTIDLTDPVVDFVYDGAEDDDVDYQTDHNLVVMWSAYDAQSGIYLCEWAIGFNPSTDDIKEFTSIDCDDGFGLATLNGTQYENVRLFSTMRFRNNAGMSTTHSSDGVVIVTRPPITDDADVRVLITSQSLYIQRGYYQSDTDNLVIAWEGFYDPVKITRYECCVGTNYSVCTGRWIVCGQSEDTQTRFHDLSLKPHTTYFVFVRAVNQVNMTSDAVVTEFITETSAPVVVSDIEITWPNERTVRLDWEGTFQANSSLTYELSVGTQKGASDVVQWLETTEVAVVLNNVKQLVDYFLALTAVNCAGLYTTVNATFYQTP